MPNSFIASFRKGVGDLLQPFDSLTHGIKGGKAVLRFVQIEVGTTGVVIMSLKLAVLQCIHVNQARTRSVESTIVLDDRWTAVGREVADLLDCHAHVLLKINRVGKVIAIEAPTHVLLVRNWRPLIQVCEFALAPRRSDIIFGASPT